jgi:chromosome segregation ATPase
LIRAENQVDELKGKIASLERHIEELMGMHESDGAEVAGLGDALEEVRAEREALGKDIREYEELTKILKDENRHLRQEHEAAQAEGRSAGQALQALKGSFDEQVCVWVSP